MIPIDQWIVCTCIIMHDRLLLLLLLLLLLPPSREGTRILLLLFHGIMWGSRELEPNSDLPCTAYCLHRFRLAATGLFTEGRQSLSMAHTMCILKATTSTRLTATVSF